MVFIEFVVALSIILSIFMVGVRIWMFIANKIGGIYV